MITGNTVELDSDGSSLDAKGAGLHAVDCSVQVARVSASDNHLSVASEQGYANAVGAAAAVVFVFMLGPCVRRKQSDHWAAEISARRSVVAEQRTTERSCPNGTPGSVAC